MDTAIELPALKLNLNGGGGQSCASCRFWHDAAMQAVQHPQAGKQLFAPCRRFPPTVLLQTVMQRGLQGMVPVQQPAMAPTQTAAGDWCGEYALDPRTRRDTRE